MKTVHITWRRVLPLCVLLFLIMIMIRNAIDDKSHDTHDRIVRNSRYFTIKEKISFNEDGALGNFESEKETPGLGPGESGRPHHLKKNQQKEEERLKGIKMSLWFLFFIYIHIIFIIFVRTNHTFSQLFICITYNFPVSCSDDFKISNIILLKAPLFSHRCLRFQPTSFGRDFIGSNSSRPA